MKKKIIIIIVAVLAICGVGITILINRSTPPQRDEIVEIDGVNFTMNAIKNRFMASDFATNNNCSVSISTDKLIITCNNKEYEFNFNGYELVINTDESGLEVYKYLVNAIEELHGYDENEYLETVQKFIDGEAVITGLRYTLIDDTYNLEVNVLDKLEKAPEKETINSEEIRAIDDVNYTYQKLGYNIYYMELTKDDYENLIVFYGIVSSDKENYNVNFTINYYDESDNLLTSETINLNEFDTFGNPYLGFSVVSRFDDVSLFNQIAKYSINLSEVGE